MITIIKKMKMKKIKMMKMMKMKMKITMMKKMKKQASPLLTVCSLIQRPSLALL
jgi:hypothetical protein